MFTNDAGFVGVGVKVAEGGGEDAEEVLHVLQLALHLLLQPAQQHDATPSAQLVLQT